MCGIAGFVGKGTESVLHSMVAAIQHRGPDYQGVRLVNNVGLGHARLSILDLSTSANQPLFNSDRSVAIVFNGEIYNYLELKDQLKRLGKYSFQTTTDTEVLLYLYEEYREKLFERINGMFAFAIYDFKRDQLLLAKDRMGKKPLYYGVFDKTIIFASELKAIIKHPSFTKQLNLNAVNEYLTFDYVPTDNSIYKNVYKLEPSSYLIFQNGCILTKQTYWNISFKTTDLSFDEAKSKLDEMLQNAVVSRLISDVPLGVFLSGGLDSSAVAYYAQKNSHSKIKTFSIGFDDSSYDESNYATKMANCIGSDHYTQILTEKQTLDLIPFITANIDEPFADPSIIPTYFLSKFTRSHVTVALGGDGSDELLAGYPTFLSEYFSNFYFHLPGFIKKMVEKSSNLLPVSDKNISFDFKVKQFVKGFESQKEYIHSLWLGSFGVSEKQKLFTNSALSQITNDNGLHSVDKSIQQVPNESEFNQLLYSYYRTYLLDDILFKVDRASMLASLEVRAPFLDYKLVEFISSLPKQYKLKRFSGKHILKEAMRNKIPNEIIDRPKKGFGIPLSAWLRNDLKGLCNDLLSERSLSKHQLFNYNYINQLKMEHFSKSKNNRKLLWNLMIFQGWYNEFY